MAKSLIVSTLSAAKGLLNTNRSLPAPPLRLSLPPPPLRVSVPSNPLSTLAALLPVRLLLRALPVPLIAAVPVRVRFSTLAARV